MGCFYTLISKTVAFHPMTFGVKFPLLLSYIAGESFPSLFCFFINHVFLLLFISPLPRARCCIWWRLARSSQSNGTCSNRFQFKAQGRGCPGDMASGSGRWPLPGVSLTNLKYSLCQEGVGNLSAGWEIRR